MEYDVGTNILVQSCNNIWLTAIIEEEDGDEIFIKYKESNYPNEWIHKDSYRIKPIQKDQEEKKLIQIPSCSITSIQEVLQIVTDVSSSEKGITTKPMHAFSVNQIDDFLAKKNQDKFEEFSEDTKVTEIRPQTKSIMDTGVKQIKKRKGVTFKPPKQLKQDDTLLDRNMSIPSEPKILSSSANNTTIQTENYNSSSISNRKPNNMTQACDSKDSQFDTITELVESKTDSQIKDSVQSIENIISTDGYKMKTPDGYNEMNVVDSDQQFQIKNNNSEVESLPKDESLVGLSRQYCQSICSRDQVKGNDISCSISSKNSCIVEGIETRDVQPESVESIKQKHQLVANIFGYSRVLHGLIGKTPVYGQTLEHPKLDVESEQGLKKDEESPPKKQELCTGAVSETSINEANNQNNLTRTVEGGSNNSSRFITIGVEDQEYSSINLEVLTVTINKLLGDLQSIDHIVKSETQNKKQDNI